MKKPKKFFNKETNSTNKQKPLLVDAFSFKDTNIKADWTLWKKNLNARETSKNIFLIFLGSILTAFSFYYFINRAGLYTNGLSAFAQLFTKLIFISNKGNDTIYKQLQSEYYYPLFFLMNLPFIIWGIFKIGFRFSVYTCLYMGLNILIVFIINWVEPMRNFYVFSIEAIQNKDLFEKFLFAFLGGVIYGAGLGVLFKAGGSSGGMDYISTYISMKRKYSIANIIKNTNIIIVVLVVLLQGLIIDKNHNVVDIYLGASSFLATLVYIYLGSFIMNRIYPKYMMITIFIISKEKEKIRNQIYSNNYLRGGNVWNVKGLYSGNEYNMMMTTMSLLEYNFFKNKIINIDPSLFMIVLPTTYMHGGNAGKPPNTQTIDFDKIKRKVVDGPKK